MKQKLQTFLSLSSTDTQIQYSYRRKFQKIHEIDDSNVIYIINFIIMIQEFNIIKQALIKEPEYSQKQYSQQDFKAEVVRRYYKSNMGLKYYKNLKIIRGMTQEQLNKFIITLTDWYQFAKDPHVKRWFQQVSYDYQDFYFREQKKKQEEKKANLQRIKAQVKQITKKKSDWGIKKFLNNFSKIFSLNSRQVPKTFIELPDTDREIDN